MSAAGTGPVRTVVAADQSLRPSRVWFALRLAGVAAGVLVLLPVQWVCWRFRLPARRIVPMLFHRWVCRVLGVRVRLTGPIPDDRPLLIVANHVSWLDISVLGSLVPLSFIAKSEVADWPLFGLFATLQRSVFVDRQRRSATRDVNREIAGRLAEGDPLILFGEGTTGDGNRILPFRSALLGAAREVMSAGDATVTVLPLAITYVRQDGLPLGRRARPGIAWYGDADLAPHLAGVLSSGPFDAVIGVGPPLGFDVASDRKALTRLAERHVRRLHCEAVTGRRPVDDGS